MRRIGNKYFLISLLCVLCMFFVNGCKRTIAQNTVVVDGVEIVCPEIDKSLEKHLTGSCYDCEMEEFIHISPCDKIYFDGVPLDEFCCKGTYVEIW